MHDPLRPHAHDPNPEPPSTSPDFLLALPDGRTVRCSIDDLRRLPRTSVPDCYIVSTGHGTSGPFTFTGVTLLEFIADQKVAAHGWREVEVLSADGFGTRVGKTELYHPDPAGPILLADEIDGRPMTRDQGAVRLIVPSEQDDALRQVKWVGRITLQP